MMRLLFLLGALVAMLFAASLAIGPAEASFAKSLSSLLTDDGTPFTLVMREIRLPRALLAVMIGASLGLAGAAMQGYLRNPLAEPGLIGVSSSAALGAVLSLQTGFAAAFALALPLSALAAALVGVLLVLLLAGPARGLHDPHSRRDCDLCDGGGAHLARAQPLAQSLRRQ